MNEHEDKTINKERQPRKTKGHKKTERRGMVDDKERNKNEIRR